MVEVAIFFSGERVQYGSLYVAVSASIGRFSVSMGLVKAQAGLESSVTAWLRSLQCSLHWAAPDAAYLQAVGGSARGLSLRAGHCERQENEAPAGSRQCRCNPHTPHLK